MRKSKDKKQIRYQMVILVEKHGIKPTARYFRTTVKTARKWYREVENFKDRDDFLNKAYSYQLFFNLLRSNSYKENKTPFYLIFFAD